MMLFRHGMEASGTIKKKIRIFVILVVICFLGLWVRIWYLQIIKWQYLTGLSESNRIRMVTLPASRGMILDRNGEVLVGIRPAFNLYLTPEDTSDLDTSLDKLSQRIFIDRKKLQKEIARTKSFKEVLIKGDIAREEVAFVEENIMSLPGIHIRAEPLRNYVFNDFAAHTLGYLGEISKSRLKKYKDSNYKQGDFVGKNGLENIYESTLRGQNGYKEVEVDVSGRELRTLRKLPPKSGNNIILTLDLKIQEELEKLMTMTTEQHRNGSAVVMKVQTGEILAVISKPSFDPNKFAAGISSHDWSELMSNEWHPLQNRTIHGQYPPGSTYKIITALAGLEEGIIKPDTSIDCPGHFKLGRGRYRCWKKSGHGAMNLHDALVQSCDVYFYTIGNRLGINTIAKYAKRFGLGSSTRLGLSREKKGLVPTTQWKLLNRKEPWQLGETISASIGQGFNLVTPIQQVIMIAAVANQGVMLKPYLVKRVEGSEKQIQKEFHPEIVGQVGVVPEHLEQVKKALRDVVNGARGTGRKSRLKNIIVSGKTGTAQVVRMKSRNKLEEGEVTPFKHRDHAWFVAFAPYENPEIAVAIIVEHGGHGGATAGPIAEKIFKKYFELYPPPL
ncbi:MAG TPA: penicillin-binding protein 2 [Nitrospinaceae bacterium]|jgi:penicillin-binding protein 2|nr:penicillin-binding protein 2 [Nitrospinaceae bacterium]HIK58653.1 penicillin-binding protein 2 [Nitrospinaceae bacterium]